MDAFTVLAELGGGADLTPGQMAQIRALDVRYQTALFRLQQEVASAVAAAPGVAHAETSGRCDALGAALRMGVRAVVGGAQPTPPRGG